MDRIAADSNVKKVLSSYPSTGPVFSQHGRLFVAQPGELYPRYPELTVGEWARLNGLDPAPLLKQLNAAAEAEERARQLALPPPTDDDRPSRRRHSLTIGYTGSFRPREDAGPGYVPVVTVQEARGPD
jgi:hypothetical protein